MVTVLLLIAETFKVVFPINRCHQRVVTYAAAYDAIDKAIEFPINRCHQRVVTLGRS